jgi:hypothetical protein
VRGGRKRLSWHLPNFALALELGFPKELQQVCFAELAGEIEQSLW